MLIFALVLALVFYYHWRRRQLYILSWKLPGPVSYPIIGNGLLFSGPTKDLLKKIRQTASYHKHPLRVWIGPKLFVYFSSAQHVEFLTQRILLSSKVSQKHEVYKFMIPVLGNGLINASGPKWKQHRKLIQPLFSVGFVSDSVETIQNHLDKCVIKLRTRANGSTFNINEDIHRCASDIVTELLMGESFNVQFSKDKENFFRAGVDGYDLLFSRLVKPWQHPDILYRMSTAYCVLKRIQNGLFTTTKEMIRKSHERIKHDRSCILDKLTSVVENKPEVISDEDLLHQMITLYLASEDTIAAIVSFTCLCFGMYPEYQEKAYEEIVSIMAGKYDAVSMKDLGQLTYLDMCIKDVLRLSPIAPFIMRQPYENFEIDTLTIPPNCGIILSIIDLHYNPVHWENPLHFHPDHFLPEKIAKRHPYAYVPFSAGPRGCIGKTFANAAVKLALVSILRNFAIEADGKLPDIELRTDISVRPVNGYMIRLKERF